MLRQVNDSNVSKFLRSRAFVYGLLVLILAFNFAIRWRVREMPLERDEGEYAYAGQLILQGVPPYELVDNMKFPGVYYAYALLMAVFGQSAAAIHTGMILVTSLSTILVFLIGCELFTDVGGLLAAAIFVCLSDLPRAAGLAGHATHFVSLFVCAGVLAVLMARKKDSRSWWFVSGTAFGLAILMIQQAVFFPVFVVAWRLWKERNKKSALAILLFCGGCVVPFLITAVGFACAGLWGKFYFWTFEYARQYVLLFPLAAAPGQFVIGFEPVFESGIWVWFAAIAGTFVLMRQNEGKTDVGLAGAIFLAGLAGTCPGLYFRNHYFIMAMPGAALLNAGFILTVGQITGNNTAAPSPNPLPRWGRGNHARVRSIGPYLSVALAVLIIGDLVVNNYQIWFTGSPAEISRQLYGNNPFPEAVPIADYLKSHTTPDDKIAMLGSEPELFFLSDRRSASGYVYIYSLSEPQPLAPQMRDEFISQIETARPKYVVFVNSRASWYSVITDESLQSAADVQDWWGNYSTNYTLAGAVKIYGDKPSQFLWDEQLSGQPDATNDDVLIYRRSGNLTTDEHR